MKKIVLALCVLLTPILARGMEMKGNIITIDSTEQSPKATINDVAWVAGHWQGEAFGGIVEELWSPPLGGTMMGAFKLVVENKVKFYEIETISEVNETLILRLKHFGADLKGWEEKDETVDFRLAKVTENKVYFDGFTFERISEDELNMYVLIESGDDEHEAKFAYKRVK